MHQNTDYSSPYYQPYPPPPNPIDHFPPPPPSPSSAPPSFASAPPYAAPDYSSFSSNYPQFPHNFPDPTPPPPHYAPPPPPPPQSQPPSEPQFQAPPYYPPYEPHQSGPTYPNYPNPNPSYPNANPNYPDPNPNYPNLNPNYSNPNPNQYDKLYDNPARYEHGSGYYEENLSGYGSFGPIKPNYDHGNSYKDDGVYAYEGRKEPYGARGTTSSKSSNWSGLFDDYGRAISFPGSKEREREKSGGGGGSGALKVVRAVPKAEEKVDGKSGVQKFRVKLLPESGGQSVMDVLCMVGLDGIRMLDPNTSRTLRIYPLETVTRCDKIDSSTFAFWSKTSVDVEPRRIRLQSNSYTTNTILDTVTAATVQFKEMGGPSRPAEPPKPLDQPGEKKKGLTDWITKLKPVNEEKDHWVPDEAVSKCTGCGSDFGAFNRRHHCRNCGDIFCDKCTQGRTPLTAEENAQPVRVCDRCMAEVTHRLSKAKEAASRPLTLQSHEDLARKLQEEMEKNLRISSSGSKSGNSGRRMKEVACPTCTVHLQVQVPSSGSETIECGVCQHPFLVSSH